MKSKRSIFLFQFWCILTWIALFCENDTPIEKKDDAWPIASVADKMWEMSDKTGTGLSNKLENHSNELYLTYMQILESCLTRGSASRSSTILKETALNLLVFWGKLLEDSDGFSEPIGLTKSKRVSLEASSSDVNSLCLENKKREMILPESSNKIIEQAPSYQHEISTIKMHKLKEINHIKCTEVTQTKSLNVLRRTQTGFEINTDAFKTVMKKVGERQFVLYSINGPTRTGKSYVLNYMIKYFESKKGNDIDWINYQLDAMFIARAGRERTTEGIHLWPEPYFVQTESGKEVAIVLMDTQGLFDENTSPLQNAFIMAVSTLCSSVMIFNAMRLLNEDILQQLQFYSNYASTTMDQDLAPEVVVTVSDNSDPSVNLEIETNKRSCQKLLFLMRDFELPDYGYGIHDDQRKPKDSIENYFTDTFRVEGREDCPDENKLVRGNILGNYNKVSIYTLPDPGKAFKRQKGDPDEDFLEGVKDLIEFLVSNENLVTKKFGDIEVTGTQFLLYVDKWAEACQNESKSRFPSVQTMAENTAWTTYSIAHTIALADFKTRLTDFMKLSENTGVSQEQLEKWRSEASALSMKIFDRQKKIKNSKFDGEFQCKLVNDMTLNFKNLEALNQKRLIINAGLKPQLKFVQQLGSNLDKGVQQLNEALKNNKIKPSPQVTQHLKDANELRITNKVLRLSFELHDDLAKMIKKIEQLKSSSQRLLNQQKSCSIL